MISQTIVTLLLINEAANILAAGGEINTEYVPAARTKRFNEPVCEPYGLDNRLFQNGGYCKDILGNRPVYGSSLFELYENEQKMRRYQMATYLLLKQRQNLTEEQKNIRDKFFWVRQSCLEEIDDIYCHHYFKRCYFSSSPQPVCREACEELTFKRCDREFKMVIGFNKERLKFPDWPFYWDIINCTILPFQNESSNCYYPDNIREKLNVLENEDCFYGNGRGYRGNLSTTRFGYTCQSWNAQYPHEHKVLSGGLHQEIRNSSNFCRNPGGLGLHGPWCFTTNKTVRWE